jgi:hypothetical protein
MHKIDIVKNVAYFKFYFLNTFLFFSSASVPPASPIENLVQHIESNH